jgi:hypothetical protein
MQENDMTDKNKNIRSSVITWQWSCDLLCIMDIFTSDNSSSTWSPNELHVLVLIRFSSLWSGGLEHLKIKTRLTDERFPSVMVSVRSRSYRSFKLSRTTTFRTVKVLVVLLEMSPWSFFFCLLWIDEGKPKDKTYIWVSVWWKTTN